MRRIGLLGNPYMPCRVNGNTTPPKVHFDRFGLIRSIPRKHGEFVVVTAAHPHPVLRVNGNTEGGLEASNGVALSLGVIASWELNHVVGLLSAIHTSPLAAVATP